MPPMNILMFSVVVAEMVLLATAVGVVGKSSLTLTLEKANHKGLELNQLKERDKIRHSRLLQQKSSAGVVNFPIHGTYNPFLVGLYYTKVQLGTPPKEFYVQIDTGSDVLWVGCNPCIGCPLTSGLKIELQFFDPSSSSTASMISCSDKRCAMGDASSDSSCSIRNQCAYSFQYGDGSTTSGYYVSDLMNLDMIGGNSVTSNSSAPVVFGCSAVESGDLSNPERAVDGIFGFGQASLSVISQLASQGITPHAFSHCLNGGNSGGGILVLGQVVDPNIVYTPLIQKQAHYNVDLQSIAVNGQKLTIDPSVFKTSEETGTIVDSGTTLAYFPQEAYDTFVDAITQSVSQSVIPFVVKGTQCYLISNPSVSEAFPQVSLNFAGGVSMNLTPDDYLLQENTKHGETAWCMGFQPIQGQGFTILGDLVLQNKIVVYDLADQKIGWVNYNCSSAVNVSTINGTIEFIDMEQNNNKSSAYHESYYKLIQNIILCLFLHISFFGVFSVL